MARQFKLPEIGEGIDSGKVLQILVSEGDTIHEGDSVVEIESDKATAEVPANQGGLVTKVHIAEGDTINVGDLILSVEAEQQTPENGGSGKAQSRPQPKPGANSSDEEEKDKKSEVDSGDKKNSGKTIEFALPPLGEGVEEAKVISIAVKAGESIATGDTLMEMETGKATVEVPAEHKGTIKEVLIKEGDTVAVGDVVLTIETTSTAKTSAESTHKESTTTENEAQSADAEDGDGESKKLQTGTSREHSETDAPEAKEPHAGAVMATPSVRRLARELGINIHYIEGTGPGKRITVDDVKRTARQLIITEDKRARRAVSPLEGEALPYDEFGPVEPREMNGVRRATAKQMARCWQEIPLVTNFDKADFSAIEDARERLENEGRKVSLTAILVKVIALGLKAYPILNAVIDSQRETYTLRRYVNIGVAVDTPRGLLVPVVRHADRLNVKEIHERLSDLAGRAREGKLRREEMDGAGFTLSNLGGLGGGHFTPIVSRPQVAILGVGQARIEPVWHENEFVPALLCPLSLSYDHRLVDGADGTRFLRWLVDAFENPLLTVLEGE